MIYSYKIQWLFTVNGSFITPTKQLRKELFDTIKSLGAKSLTVVNFRNEKLKVIDNYSSMIMYPYGSAEKELIKYIKKSLKNNQEIKYVELIRR